MVGLLLTIFAPRFVVNRIADQASRTREPFEGKRIPVLVELFTSEGCSSCPPADELLMRLEKTQPVPGAEIIALGEHVDYWNRLGWADPYSSAEFSERQRAYARAFRSDTIYTPQMVVDGQAEFVGSDGRKAQDAIAKVARAPKATVQLTRGKNPAGEKSNAIQLQVRVENLPAVSAGDTAEVFLAITESHLHSSVSRGENAGRRLSHTAVVRQLSIIGRVSATTSFTAEPIVTLASGWKQENLRAVVFVQERASRRVLGAAAIGLIDKCRVSQHREQKICKFARIFAKKVFTMS
jgi:hypothetical protein